MVLDIHSHILWGLDDGAQTIEDTLQMAKAAVADGITHIVATPHHHDGKYFNEASVVLERVHEANDLMKQHGIPLCILPGMEIRLYGEIIEDFRAVEKKLLTLNEAQRYVLIELPHDHVPKYTSTLLFDLQVEGYIPVIAHPERNHQIREHPGLLYRFIEKGNLAQVTAASVAGQFGAELQKFSFKLMKHNLIHFVACDAHNTGRRGFTLQAAYDVITKEFGKQYTDFYKQNAKDAVEGRDIYVEEPVSFEKRKKRFFGLF
jgi:protein-tyrosine phosphatase